MNKLSHLLTALIFLLSAYSAIGQESTFDQEKVFFKDSIDQPHATIQSNLIIKLSPEDFSRVDTIHITGMNTLASGFTKHLAKIDPRTAFIIEDATTRSLIKEYLLKDLDLDMVETRIRNLYGVPDMKVHPLVFADPDQSMYLIKMFDRNYGEVSFKYDVRIDYMSGQSKTITEGISTTINKPLSLTEKNPIR